MTIDWMAFAWDAGAALAFLAAFIILLLVAIFIKDVGTPYRLSEEILDKQNAAVGLTTAGYIIAVAIVFVAASSGPSAGLVMDVATVTGYAALGVVFINLTRLAVDRILFRSFCTITAVAEERNMAYAAVRAAAYVATGLIAGAAITGQGGGVLTAVAFFALGQIALIGFTHFYDRLTPFQLEEEIAAGNTAAGVGFAGTLLAFGVILANAVAGDFTGWVPGLISFLKAAGLGAIVMALARLAFDRVVIPGVDLNRLIVEDRNLGAGLIEMAIAVAIAAVFAILL